MSIEGYLSPQTRQGIRSEEIFLIKLIQLIYDGDTWMKPFYDIELSLISYILFNSSPAFEFTAEVTTWNK